MGGGQEVSKETGVGEGAEPRPPSAGQDWPLPPARSYLTGKASGPWCKTSGNQGASTSPSQVCAGPGTKEEVRMAGLLERRQHTDQGSEQSPTGGVAQHCRSC